ncbi:MAG: endonuclease/exonuclease/phosphatase family protein [Acidimicrobiia bacterium]|nr:endonuclease/exonuclease/phosphatase family protein [Acidimicrobiia bacterium]
MSWTRRILIGLAAFLVLLALVVRFTTFHPRSVQDEAVTCPADTPELKAGESVKVLSWNVQYMAGKDYVFWYDLFDESGPDERPSTEAIATTFDEVARIIAEESPDVILLQEVDDGASRTDREDQLERLLGLLPGEYACSASAFYWKARFVPHSRIMGSVGMKLSTISRYRITEATRYQLPAMPSDPLTRQFDLKRAILEIRLPVTGGVDFVALNTHLDAFAQGSDTMQRQVALVGSNLRALSAAGNPWVIGGDFNLLPPGPQYANLPVDQRVYYQPRSELAVLTDAYPVVPSVADANGPAAAAWFTHYPNDPTVSGPDRTIDFVFYSPVLELGGHRVRADDTLAVSDHLPVIATFSLP